MHKRWCTRHNHKDVYQNETSEWQPKAYICHYDYVKHKNNPVIYLACCAPLTTCKFGESELRNKRQKDYKLRCIGDQTSYLWCFEKVVEGEGG